MYCGLTLKNKIYMNHWLSKKENVDLEKQVNKLNNFLVLNKSIKAVLTFNFGSFSQVKAQEKVPFDQKIHFSRCSSYK
jgi:hypothetical protein